MALHIREIQPARTANYPSGAPTAQGLSFAPNSSTVFLACIAFDSAGNMSVTDPGNRRVLEFNAADVATGGGLLTAAVELGQLDFVSVQTALNPASGRLVNQFAVPSQLTFDGAGNLYVFDADPNYPQFLSRVLVFTPTSASGTAAFTTGRLPRASWASLSRRRSKASPPRSNWRFTTKPNSTTRRHLLPRRRQRGRSRHQR